LDKAPGPTSHDVVAAVRRSLRIRRVGHGGTLDPFASGLLPVLTGRATRLAPFVLGLPKTYHGVLRLGIATDTDDATGTVLRDDPSWRSVDDEMLGGAMLALTGQIAQTPPAYSAKKVAGTRAHRLARRGGTVDLAPRRVTVVRFIPTARTDADITFSAEVGSGTYIRALARDLGARLGCGAHLLALRRVGIGPWTVDQAACTDPWPDILTVQPALTAVSHLPRRDLTPDEVGRILHGQAIDRGADTGEGPVTLVADGTLLAVGAPRKDLILPTVVLAG
jgi:tRNA pseudouridine55 synthase